MLSHPDFPRLAEALRRLPRRPWKGVAYRSCSPRYARSADVLSGEGVRRHGGRWNTPELFPAVYASLSPETAVAESLSHFRHYGIPLAEALPRVLLALDVRLSETGDLTSGTARKGLRVSRRRMRAEPWRRAQEGGREALTQAIGRAAFDAGLEALIVPSAADPAGANLVVFPGRLSAGSRLAVRDAPDG
jgi:RES domain-containing protein